MFLLKTVFWLSIVILLIPAGKETGTTGHAEVSAFEVVSAAKAVWIDLSGFCERNRDACETGGRLATRFGEKARNGAHMLHELVGERSGEDGSDADVTASTSQ